MSDRFRAVPAGDTFIHRQVTAGAVAATTRAGAAQPSVQHRRPATRPPTRRRRERTGPREAGAETTESHRPAVPPESATSADLLARIGQDAIAAGDFGAAVVAFRKCAYLAPHDPVAQLHLGLALDAAGDEPSAQRAYAAARHALLQRRPSPQRCRHRGLRHR